MTSKEQNYPSRLLEQMLEIVLTLGVDSFRIKTNRGASALIEFDDDAPTTLLVSRAEFRVLIETIFVERVHANRWRFNEAAFALLEPPADQRQTILL